MRRKRSFGISDVDESAQILFQFAQIPANIRYRTNTRCRLCGGEVLCYYCEEAVYLVRCGSCKVLALTEAYNVVEAGKNSIGEEAEQDG